VEERVVLAELCGELIAFRVENRDSGERERVKDIERTLGC